MGWGLPEVGQELVELVDGCGGHTTRLVLDPLADLLADPLHARLLIGRQAAAPTTRVVHTLGRNDQLVELDRPKQKPAWLSDEDFEQLPARITLRQVRYRVKTTRGRTSHVTLLTTLTDPRKDRYSYMTKPRDELRKALEINRVAA